MPEEEVSKQSYYSGYPSDYAPGYGFDEPVWVLGVFRVDANYFVILQTVRDRRIAIVRISEPEYRFLRRVGVVEIMVGM
ncbi:MAG: hypothetical protein AB1776_02845 [Bacillota bacterium]